MSVDGRKQVLQAHLASGEEAIEGHSTDEKSFVVTERRLLVITEGGDKQSVETIPFDQTSGVLVESYPEEDPNTTLAALGAVAGVLGIGSFVAAGGNTGGNAGFLMALGFAGFLGGIALLAIAFDTADGHTALTIQRTGSAPERTFSFRRDADGFAAEVSKQAAKTP